MNSINYLLKFIQVSGQMSDMNTSSTYIIPNNLKIIKMWNNFKCFQQNISAETIKQKTIMIVGSPKCGKTALSYYMSGLELVSYKESKYNQQQVKAKQTFKDYYISHDFTTKSIPHVFQDHQGQVSIFDLPSFQSDKLTKLIIFRATIQEVLRDNLIHIVLVIEQGRFDVQGLLETLDLIGRLFNLKNLMKNEAQCRFSFVVSKTTEEIDTLRETFKQLLQQLIDEQLNPILTNFAKYVLNVVQKQQETILFTFPCQQIQKQQGQKLTQTILERQHFINPQKDQILNQNFMSDYLKTQIDTDPHFRKRLQQILTQLSVLLEDFLSFAQKFLMVLGQKQIEDMKQNEESREILNCLLENIPISQFVKKTNFSSEILTYDLLSGQVLQQKQLACLFLGWQKMIQVVKSNQEKLLILNEKFIEQVLLFLENTVNILNSRQRKSLLFMISQFQVLLKWFYKNCQTSLPLFETLIYQKYPLKGQFQKFIAQCDQSLIIEIIRAKEFNKMDQQVQNEEQKLIKKLQKQYCSAPISLSLQEKGPQQIDRVIWADERVILFREIVEKIQKFILNQDISQQLDQHNKQQILSLLGTFCDITFVRSALKYFILYLDFIFKASQQKKSIKISVRHFINNICQVLEHYSIYEQQLLLKLFIVDFVGINGTLDRASRNKGIEKDFLKVLKYNLLDMAERIKMFSTKTKHQKLRLIKNIIQKIYSVWSVEQSKNREEQIKYQGEYIKTIRQIDEQRENISKQKASPKEMFYFAALKSFCPQKVIYRMEKLEQRNQQYLSTHKLKINTQG